MADEPKRHVTEAPSDEEAYELWDWARTAGISRDELKRAVDQASASADREEP